MKNILIKDIIFEKRNKFFKNDYSILSDWDIARKYAKGELLSESYNIKGKILLEGLWDGLVSAASWIGEKGSELKKLASKIGTKVLEQVQKLLILVIETIPGGKYVFEILKEFSTKLIEDASESLKSVFDSVLGEFIEFINTKKDELIKNLLSGTMQQDLGIMEKIKEIFLKQHQNLKDKINSIYENLTNPSKFLESLWEQRGVLAGYLKIAIEVILKTLSSEKRNSILDSILDFKFFRSEGGNLFRRLITILTINPESEYSDEDKEADPKKDGSKFFKAISNIWTSLKNLIKKGDIEPESQEDLREELIDFLPEIFSGLLSGESVLENSIRSLFGDPKAPFKLLLQAIKLIFRAIKEKITKAIENFAEENNIDKEGKLFNLMITGLESLLSYDEEFIINVTGAEEKSESRNRRKKYKNKKVLKTEYRKKLNKIK